MSTAIQLDLYRWAGKWGPFKVKIPCGECTLTGDIIRDVLETDLKNVPVQVTEYDWLSNWWKPLPAGGWHAPIIMVEGKVIGQGEALNRGVLVEAIIRAHAARTSVSGTVMFSKDNCTYCHQAADLLKAEKTEFAKRDVVKDPPALYEMLARVKPIIGPKTPVTTPQIWIDGSYVGGFEELKARFRKSKAA